MIPFVSSPSTDLANVTNRKIALEERARRALPGTTTELSLLSASTTEASGTEASVSASGTNLKPSSSRTLCITPPPPMTPLGVPQEKSSKEPLFMTDPYPEPDFDNASFGENVSACTPDFAIDFGSAPLHGMPALLGLGPDDINNTSFTGLEACVPPESGSVAEVVHMVDPAVNPGADAGIEHVLGPEVHGEHVSRPRNEVEPVVGLATEQDRVGNTPRGHLMVPSSVLSSHAATSSTRENDELGESRPTQTVSGVHM